MKFTPSYSKGGILQNESRGTFQNKFVSSSSKFDKRKEEATISPSGAQIDVIPTRVHGEPYTLNLLNDGTNMRVKKQALVTYSIRGSEDDRWCDILPMDACHLLIGRP